MKTASWILAGATFGAAASLLTAPRPGWRTRRMLRRKADEGCEYLSVAGDDLRRATSRFCRRAEGRVKGAIREVRAHAKSILP